MWDDTLEILGFEIFFATFASFSNDLFNAILYFLQFYIEIIRT